MIDLTPLEVRKKKGDFRRTLRGYEPALVDDFLDLAADRIEQLAREKSALTELERRVSEYRDRERALTDALVTAQEMREEIRAQTAREAEVALRTSAQEVETRLRDAEQRAEAVVREAEVHAETTLREAEQRAQVLVRESEQHAATTVRSAEQGAEDTLRLAQQEADAALAQARQEAERLRTEVIQVREREEEALRRLRLHQQQQVSSYRNFLERELAELEIVATSLTLGEAADRPGSLAPGEAADRPGTPPAGVGLEGLELTDLDRALPAQPRDSRAAAAAAVLAQSFLADDAGQLNEAAFPVDPADFEPFEPEPVYAEDLDPRDVRIEPTELIAGEPIVMDLTEVGVPPEDQDTAALLENAELAGYHLELADEQGGEPELLLEEPASDEDKDDDDWLTRMIEDKG